MRNGYCIDLDEYHEVCDLLWLDRVLVSERQPLERPRYKSQFPDSPDHGVFAGVFDHHNIHSGNKVRQLIILRSSPHCVSDLLTGDCSTPNRFSQVYQRRHTNCVWDPISEVGFGVIDLGAKTLEEWILDLTVKYSFREPIIGKDDAWAVSHFFGGEDYRKLRKMMKAKRFTFVRPN